MPSCAAFQCTNRSASNKNKDNKLSFHRIPSEEENGELRKKWLQNIRRAGQLPKDSGFYICSAHFEKDCFKRDFQVCNFSSTVNKNCFLYIFMLLIPFLQIITFILLLKLIVFKLTFSLA